MKITECRKEVQEFAIAMEKKLREHDDRPGWKGDSFECLFSRMLEEAGEVLTDRAAITGNDPGGEAVDVANFAMMIWDNLK